MFISRKMLQITTLEHPTRARHKFEPSASFSENIICVDEPAYAADCIGTICPILVMLNVFGVL